MKNSKEDFVKKDTDDGLGGIKDRIGRLRADADRLKEEQIIKEKEIVNEAAKMAAGNSQLSRRVDNSETNAYSMAMEHLNDEADRTETLIAICRREKEEKLREATALKATLGELSNDPDSGIRNSAVNSLKEIEELEAGIKRDYSERERVLEEKHAVLMQKIKSGAERNEKFKDEQNEAAKDPVLFATTEVLKAHSPADREAGTSEPFLERAVALKEDVSRKMGEDANIEAERGYLELIIRRAKEAIEREENSFVQMSGRLNLAKQESNLLLSKIREEISSPDFRQLIVAENKRMKQGYFRKTKERNEQIATQTLNNLRTGLEVKINEASKKISWLERNINNLVEIGKEKAITEVGQVHFNYFHYPSWKADLPKVLERISKPPLSTEFKTEIEDLTKISSKTEELNSQRLGLIYMFQEMQAEFSRSKKELDSRIKDAFSNWPRFGA